MPYTQQGNVRGKIEGTETCLGKALFFKNTVSPDFGRGFFMRFRERQRRDALC